MRTLEQQQKSKEIYQSLINEAYKNPEFKNQLVENPVETMANFFGKDPKSLLSEKEIIVEDQSDNSVIFINIPFKVDLSEYEMTQEELELISGGADSWGDIAHRIGRTFDRIGDILDDWGL